MNPSPESVVVQSRARFRSWGHILATPAVLALIGLPLVIYALILALRPGPPHSDTTGLLVIGVPLIVIGLAILAVSLLLRAALARRQADLQAHLDELIDLLDGASRMFALERIAQLCALRASRRWRGPRLFDLDLWERATGDRCPRAIILDPVPDPLREVEAVTEEIDLESEATVPRGRIVRQLALSAPILVLAAILWTGAIIAGARFSGLATILTIGGLIAIYQAFRRAGWRAVAIRSAVASPGRIEFGGLTGARAFTLDDAILLLMERKDTDWFSSKPRLTMTLLRTDGATRFLTLSGPRDPRIGEAISRWTAGASLSKDSAPNPTSSA